MKINTLTKEEAKGRGYAVFSNTSTTKHTVVDLSRTRTQKDIVLQLPNKDIVTVSSIPNGENGAVLLSYHNKEKRTIIKTFNGKNKDVEVDGSFILYYGKPSAKENVLLESGQKLIGDNQEKDINKTDIKFPNTDIVDIVQEKEERTLSIKLPNKDCVTVCSIPFFTADGGKSGTLDIKYHNEDKKTLLWDFSDPSKIVEVKGLFTLDYQNK